MTPYDLLLLPENLLWAWRKAKKCYRMADGLYDQTELAGFELNLEAELDSIRKDFEIGRWTCAPLRLVPQPKKPKDGNPRFRQYFEVSVRDQVAWLAVTNVIGPELDMKMPAWSYGNRLYRAAWYEDGAPEDLHSKLHIGPYRHSAGNLYRHFKHSWPLYRRHISLTARRMVAAEIDANELDIGERLALGQSDDLTYLDPTHWNRPDDATDTIYAASLDLRKFYPSVRAVAIVRSLQAFVPGYAEDRRLPTLVDQMLAFTVDISGVSDEMWSDIDPPVEEGAFDRIPTGLFVGGFLANVAMLPIDLEVEAILSMRRDIAHFRFVDDHEVLAYDFETLLNWMTDYNDLLQKHDIGAEIEVDKYVPAELKWLLHTDEPLPAGQDLVAIRKEAEASAELNGRKPTKLMTRTLAQVSLIAATDFDLLTDAGRSQRLELLEWLLLANIPDEEIRGDTRMAFAASKIAALTPALFRPNDKLLLAYRELAALETKQKKDQSDALEAQISAVRSEIDKHYDEERKEWSSLLRKHFSLLFEAFVTHPDKVRLFTRLIDFCRTTGHDGFTQITDWMAAHEEDGLRHLKCYLGASALQIMARHTLTACVTAIAPDLLHRERAAAKAFIEHVLKADLDRFVPPSGLLQHFQRSAKSAFVSALTLGAQELAEALPELSNEMSARAAQWSFGRQSLTISDLAESINVPVGVLYHWFFATTGSHRHSPPGYWAEIAAAHDPSNHQDWNSLRRFPALLPTAAWEHLASDPALLRPDDAGWLLDAFRSAPERMGQISSGWIGKAKGRAAADSAGPDRRLSQWVDYVRTLEPSDPRRSEWTALEIIRQLLEPFARIDGPDADLLDAIHPENILVPQIWFEPDERARIDGKITWEGWRALAHEHAVTVADEQIEDYRYRELLELGDRSWALRLRPIGQLLWGLLRQSFSLPAAWNIRGQERSLVQNVAWDLERLPISSFTLSILQSCMLPRNRETSLMVAFPTLFGNSEGKAADDTEFDSPIATLEQLEALLKKAQAILEHSQMTVLEHEPRQLIPVRLRHIASFGIEDEADQDIAP